MIQRRTQTAAYWEDEYEFGANDVGRIHDQILDLGRPVSSEELARLEIERLCRQEEESIRAGLSEGQLYRPREEYQEGEELIFPALDFARGTVKGSRPGRNPEYGDFTVIQVELHEDAGGSVETREFASGLIGPHALDQVAGKEDLLAAGELQGLAELYDAYGDIVKDEMAEVLTAHKEFVLYKEDWFLRELLASIQTGHLHIAEALIEVQGRPMQPAEFLTDLGLPAEIPEVVQILSLNYALEGDERFDNIGDSGRDIWYLRRLIPHPVVEPPARLALSRVAYNRNDISPELLEIEQDIDDEGSGREVWGEGRRIYHTTIALTYPHRRCGTLPLTLRTRALFPQATRHHTPIVLLDGQTGAKMQGWIVHAASFVYGLEKWYSDNKLPVGARIKLERTRDPRVITVDYERQRLQPTWIPLVRAEGNAILFQMRKLPISCDFDERLAIAEDNPVAIDKIWSETRARGDSPLEIMTQIMPSLIKLSPQGTVHAKTIYSAVNVLKRVAPGPVFALLSKRAEFVSMGGGYWTFDPALIP